MSGGPHGLKVGPGTASGEYISKEEGLMLSPSNIMAKSGIPSSYRT
jgi:hypothetical protein